MARRSKIENDDTAVSVPFTEGMRATLVKITWELGDPLCAAELMELVHVECQREASGRVLRLYIDKPDGVTLEDCSRISRQMSDLLDVHADVAGTYHLEVSSPGLARPVSKPADFERFTGKGVEIRMALKVAGRKKVKGTLGGIREADDVVIVVTEDGRIEIPRARIVRARLNIDGAA